MVTKADRHPMVTVNCQFCGIEFQARKERVDKGLGRFCSREHSNAWQRQQNTTLGETNAIKFFDKSQNSWKVHWLDKDRGQHSSTYSHWRWKQLHGDIPVGFRVGFVDGDPLNIEDDNLKLISEGEISLKISRSKMGWNPSEETRKRMSESDGKKVLSSEHRAKIGEAVRERWQRGEFNNQKTFPEDFVLSEEQKIRIRYILEDTAGVSSLYKKRLENLLSGNLDDEDRAWWKRRKIEIPYPPEFTHHLNGKIRERDNHICQICGRNVKGSKFGHVHHIDGSRRHNLESNLILLCENCHKQVHGQMKNWIGEKVIQYQSLLKYDDNGQCET